MSKVKTSIPVSTGQRSHADLSAVSIGTTDFGRLDVLYHTPVNPGEDVKLNIKGVLQSAPMVVNTFGEFRYDVRAFFVPYRILTHRPEEGRGFFVWDYFINNLSNVTHPYITYRNISWLNSSAGGSNFTNMYEHQDYKRLISQLRYPKWLVNLTSYLPDSSPIGNKTVNIWAPMSYQRIWWDFYRNSQLIDESLLSTYIPYPSAGSQPGSNFIHYYQPRYACFDKDYFTNCIPTQALETFGTPAAQSLTVESAQDFNFGTASDNYIVDSVSSGIVSGFGHNSDGTMHVPAKFIRAALAYDNYLSKMQIVGTRIRDRVRARFGLSQSSESVNTSQYLGGASARFTCGKMMNLADTYDLGGQGATPPNPYFITNTEQGSPSGTRVGNIDEGFGTGDINFHVKEYGTIMVIGTLIPKTGYYQGMNKDLTLGTASSVQEQREQYLTPELANTGLVPIRQSEIFGTSTYDASDNVFGWTQKYGSYTWQPSVVDGDMILTDTNTGMSAFHTFREFSSSPTYSNAFTMITPSERVQFDRIFQVQNHVQGESTFDHFNRFTRVQCDVTRAIPASWLPELYEDNNHGNTIKVDIGGSRVN